MSLKSIIFAFVFFTAFFFVFYNLKRLTGYLFLARPDVRWDYPLKRVINTIKVALAQSKILRDKIAGPIHVSIFWGFMTLLFSAFETVFQGFFPTFSWNILGPLFILITLSTDIFCVLIIFAVIFAFSRRFVFRVKRVQGDKREVIDAVIVLATIFIIVSSLLLQNSALSFIERVDFSENWAFRPVSVILSGIFSKSSANTSYEIFWWIHILFIFGFMNYLPYSKHLHVYTSILNVFFSSFKPVNKLERIDFEQEGLEKFGIVDFEDLSWKSIFDSYSCTHCGRCDSVCPANLTGKILSPRDIIMKIRKRTIDRAPILQKMNKAAKLAQEQLVLNEKEETIINKKFVGDYENIEALWQCTSCGACMQECPVSIEHVPAIIGMRRSLVMMESNFPTLLQGAFNNLENNSTPWAFPSSERGDWAIGTGVKTAAENPDFDVLFWVGCAGSFDDRSKKVSVAFSKLLLIAGVNFSILGSEEMCNGDPARRTGQEYLADMLVKANIETLNRYNVKKIVTFCPHCFNTLKNEYPDFGGKFEVFHHSEYLNQLIKEGKLKIKAGDKNHDSITYHDSCYLGRYNNSYKPAREIIQIATGLKIKEVDRSRDKGLCCGAGGGQMFMEETEGKRVNIERTEELLETGASTIALNCPFCMTMITDGVKDKEKIEQVRVLDISEILLENVEVK